MLSKSIIISFDNCIVYQNYINLRIYLSSFLALHKGRPQNKKVSFWLTFSRPPPPPAKPAFKKYKIGAKPMLET